MSSQISSPGRPELLSCSASDGSIRLSFTGERVIPDAVEPQLWNEHVARYRFASLLARGKRVLDIGCGTGYGTELLTVGSVNAVGMDSSDEAIQYARQRFQRARFLCSSADAIPFPAESFELITAFEVIEHLVHWDAMLAEAARLLTSDGTFLVSTPNIDYYAEARGDAGPNPFHVHEFELAEFEAELKRHFPCVRILAQNQQENITFSGGWAADSCTAFIPPTDNVADCHFFVAACSFRPVTIPFFSDVSTTHNLLRDRERHIRGLQGELQEARKERGELAERNRVLSEANRSLSDELGRARQCAWIRVGRMLGVGPWSAQGLGRFGFDLSSLIRHLFRPDGKSFDAINSLVNRESRFAASGRK